MLKKRNEAKDRIRYNLIHFMAHYDHLVEMGQQPMVIDTIDGILSIVREEIDQILEEGGE